ncbi:hypothetical protein C8Q80DRAFT_946693 [Daedaleopsis nitida]|nr:hypothetical protein C8Q80DRAFT_946693 [Daedaleopsis nitida]
MVKQWLGAYKLNISGSSPNIARTRQHRLNGLKRWRVAEIIAMLPVLLQAALALYFAGLLVLLWHLNDVVAAISTVLIGTLCIRTVATVMMPAFSRNCCYISPPAIALAAALPPLICAIRDLLHQASMALPSGPWVQTALCRGYCYLEHSPATLTIRGKELIAIARDEEQLDADMASTAYTTTMDPCNITASMPTIMTLSPANAYRYFSRIKLELVRHMQWDTIELHVPQYVLINGFLTRTVTADESIRGIDSEARQWVRRFDRWYYRYSAENVRLLFTMLIDTSSVISSVSRQDQFPEDLYKVLLHTVRSHSMFSLSVEAGKCVAALATNRLSRLQANVHAQRASGAAGACVVPREYSGAVALLVRAVMCEDADCEHLRMVCSHLRYWLGQMVLSSTCAAADDSGLWHLHVNVSRESIVKRSASTRSQQPHFGALAGALDVLEEADESSGPSHGRRLFEECLRRIDEWWIQVQHTLSEESTAFHLQQRTE